ncbi:MAG: hypothetical protein M1827_004347 [Pycnora praestabilis]|nr:MAG: hypothetical protein M1827_004347 [Pycnora praestabilis]
MPITIEDLPYELISSILHEAARLNANDGVTFTYGISEAPLPLQNVKLQKYVRGHVPPDILRWSTSDSIRQVNQRWHHWALEFALRDFYVRRWRGSERWIESRNLSTLAKKPSGMAVYRGSFDSLRQTARMLSDYPDVASYIRRIWSNGFYVAETDKLLFQLLQHCTTLRSATLPWTTLRHGSWENWSQLLDGGPGHESLSSLELLAVDLKESQTSDTSNRHDTMALEDLRVDFSRLTRLKIFGNTSFNPITDSDLRFMAKTASNLEELHITGLSTVTNDGVMALVQASKETLRVLEYSPLSDDGFEHPDPSSGTTDEHLCAVLINCPLLEDLSISVPSICPTLFSDLSVQWLGELQVRAAGLCEQNQDLVSSADARNVFWGILEQARSLIASRERKDALLEIEIFISHWIFEPHHTLVHGNVDIAEVASDYTWPTSKQPSGKGPYGQTGLYGKDAEGPYSSILESEFVEGLKRGYVTF